MSEPTQRVPRQDGEEVRRSRLRRDGRRPHAVNLRDTIAHSRRLFELRDAAGRARDSADLEDLETAHPERST